MSFIDELCAVCNAESIFQVIYIFFPFSTYILLSFQLFLELEIGYMYVCVCVCVKVDKITDKTILSSIESEIVFLFIEKSSVFKCKTNTVCVWNSHWFWL